jgi:hypothetical protein
MNWWAKAALLAVCGELLLGCFGGGTDRFKAARPKTAPAAGTVTYKDQPLEGAFVLFHPSDPKGTAAAGFTNSSGQFVARAFPPDEGVVPGTYKITIEKSIEAAAPTTAGGSADAHDAIDKAAMATAAAKSLIPVQYTKPDSTPIKLEIPVDGNKDIKLDVK